MSGRDAACSKGGVVVAASSLHSPSGATLALFHSRLSSACQLPLSCDGLATTPWGGPTPGLFHPVSAHSVTIDAAKTTVSQYLGCIWEGAAAPSISSHERLNPCWPWRPALRPPQPRCPLHLVSETFRSLDR